MADKEACDSKSGNAKDVCIERAKAKEKVAKADNLAAYKNTAKARQDARIARAEADYAVASEKCDDLQGDQKDACVKEAKAAEAKAKAEARRREQRNQKHGQAQGAPRRSDAGQAGEKHQVAQGVFEARSHSGCHGSGRGVRLRFYDTFTLANLRFPACTTTVLPAATVRFLSATISPSTFNPRPAIKRSASEVDSTSPACFASWAIGIPWPLVCSLTSGMFSGTAWSRNRASNVESASSAARFE